MSKLHAWVLAMFRIVIGLLFALHGASALFGVLGGLRGTGATVAFGTWPGWWASVIQLLGGALVVFGLGTRWSALLCSGSMAYAYFVVHQPQALDPLNNGGELAALFCWSFFMIAVVGPGAVAIDNSLKAIWRRRVTPATA